jgi:transposase-like protein
MAARDTRAIRREQVERCLSTTGMTIKEWCELNGVPASTMYFWMSKFRKEEPELFGQPNATEWIEVTRESIAARTALAKREGAAAPAAAASGKTSAESAGAPAGSAVIVRLNGADVVVPDGAAERHIASVLRAVASL